MEGEHKPDHEENQKTAEGHEGTNTDVLNRKPRLRPVFRALCWELVRG